MAETKQIPTITEVTVAGNVLDIYTYYDASFEEFLHFFIVEILSIVGNVSFAEGELGYTVQGLPNFSAYVSDQGELVINDTATDIYFLDNNGYLISGDILLAPVALAGSVVASTSFTANWNAVTGATKYYLDVSIDPQFNSYLSGYKNKDVGNVLTYNVTGLISGVTYYYRVRAYDGIQTSLDSNIISVSLKLGYGALYNWYAATKDSGYGALYNWYAATYSTGGASIAPAGWHVPTDAEYVTLKAYVGTNPGLALREVGTVHWNTNVLAVTNSTGFTGVGSGYRIGDSFSGLKSECFLLTSDINGIAYELWNEYQFEKPGGNWPKSWGTSIRLIKDDSTDPGILIDIDGNRYPTVKIGTQVWMANNLRVTKYNDGTPITLGTVNWGVGTVGKYCYYNNVAPVNQQLAPVGWHVPTLAEIRTLFSNAGSDIYGTDSGTLKESGTTHWVDPNLGGTDAFGFKALPGGLRNSWDNHFEQLTVIGSIATNEISAPGNFYCMRLFYDTNGGDVAGFYFNDGVSIRLIKDDSVDPGTVTDIDNNVYPTVKIGTQVWMAANLKVEHYNDGTAITNITGAVAWAADTIGAMCYYDNNINYA